MLTDRYPTLTEFFLAFATGLALAILRGLL